MGLEDARHGGEIGEVCQMGSRSLSRSGRSSVEHVFVSGVRASYRYAV